MKSLHPQGYPQVVRLGLVGKNITYSKSPELHEKWLKKHVIQGRYDLIDRPKFDQGVIQQLRDRGYLGVNVTMPYKQDAALLADEVDEVVRATAAANCLYFGEKVMATNTDAVALYEILKPYNNFKNALIIGTGATSRSTSWALQKLGCQNIRFASRSRQRESFLSLKDLKSYIEEFNLVVNASPWGMHNVLEDICLDRKERGSLHCVVDWVYLPVETYLLNWAQKNNIPTVKGMDLLIYQAKISWKFWRLL